MTDQLQSVTMYCFRKFETHPWAAQRHIQATREADLIALGQLSEHCADGS